MAKDKVRIRKAPTLREQAEAARAKAEAKAGPSKLSSAKAKLPKPQLGKKVARMLWIILKPVRVILRPLGFLAPTYFVNSWREVRQVTWPTRRETWRLTLAVFIFAIIFGLMIAGVDKVLDLLFKKVILKQ